MKTKLVYVLTCSPEGNYIEQAVLATFSARYHNPSAHIVLIVDNKTDELISDGRGEVLKYISEKVVVPFDEDKTMMYRSRWIKTSVRNLIDGDYLFIDCDTITTRCLDEVDSFECVMGAVPDAHLPIKDFNIELYNHTDENVRHLSIDLSKETFYFNSGVCYVKDTEETRRLYSLWHRYWLEGLDDGIRIDQPSLLKADIESCHLISELPYKYNCLSFTQPDFAKDSSILHFLSFRNQSWLFSKRVLRIIGKEGTGDWLVPFIINPTLTYIPYRYTISKMSLRELFKSIKQVSNAAKVYGRHVDSSFSDMVPSNRWYRKAKGLFSNKRFFLGSAACILPAWISIRAKHSSTPVPNVCAK